MSIVMAASYCASQADAGCMNKQYGLRVVLNGTARVAKVSCAATGLSAVKHQEATTNTQAKVNQAAALAVA